MDNVALGNDRYRCRAKHDNLHGSFAFGKILSLFEKTSLNNPIQRRKKPVEIFPALGEYPVLLGQLAVFTIYQFRRLDARHHPSKRHKTLTVKIRVVGKIDKNLRRTAVSARTGSKGKRAAHIAGLLSGRRGSSPHTSATLSPAHCAIQIVPVARARHENNAGHQKNRVGLD